MKKTKRFCKDHIYFFLKKIYIFFNLVLLHLNNHTKICNFIKKETMAQVFSCEFYEISKGIPEFLDSGRKSWTLDSGRWNLDNDHCRLILRTALILCSQSWRVSQRRNDTLIILQTKNRADSFFITGKYHTKKQNITSHLKVFLKRATR